MSTYKIYYFNERGRAETIRLIFAAAGEKYEDIRFERSEWPIYRADMPLGQIPVLEVDGVKLPQSMSIARFVAKQFHLAGKDNFEQAKVDAVADTITDLTIDFIPVHREQDQIKKQELKQKFQTEKLPKHLQNIEALGKLYSDDGLYFVGSSLTWVDLFFYNFGEIILTLVDRNALDEHPWLKQNRAAVAKQPRIAEYLKDRPKTQL